MLTQQRLLLEQRRAHRQFAEHAAADERRRIARRLRRHRAFAERHLLHVTARRRALQERGDVDDAEDALQDAEAAGPAGDGRHPPHAVGLPTTATPAPPRTRRRDDIPALVDRFHAGRPIQAVPLDRQSRTNGFSATRTGAVPDRQGRWRTSPNMRRVRIRCDARIRTIGCRAVGDQPAECGWSAVGNLEAADRARSAARGRTRWRHRRRSPTGQLAGARLDSVDRQRFRGPGQPSRFPGAVVQFLT